MRGPPQKKWNSLLMLQFWWNLIFICKIGLETDSASIFAHILLFLEKIVIFLLKKMIFSYLDVFTQFEFDFTTFELKQIQIVFWNPENISNKTTALDFQIYPWFFLRWLKMYLSIEKPWFFKMYPIFHYIIIKNMDENQKSRAVVL